MSSQLEEQRKEILSELVMSEEQLLTELKALVQAAKPFISISDQDQGEIVVKKSKDYTNTEKILLYLTGAYFANQLGFRKTAAVGLSELSEKLHVRKTTLSAPLTSLVGVKSKIKRDGGIYSIKFYEIKPFLEGLEKGGKTNE